MKLDMTATKLIDVNEAIKQLDPNTWQGEMLIAILKGLPTAYDVDKVVEQLVSDTEVMNDGLLFIPLHRAITIVKGAVKDDDYNYNSTYADIL